MKLLLPLRRKEEEGINGREVIWYAALYITFITVQEEKYQNQASGCCTRIHYNQRYKVIKQDYRISGPSFTAQHNSPQESDR